MEQFPTSLFGGRASSYIAHILQQVVNASLTN